MGQFFKFLFASCLGTTLALFLLFFILIIVGTSQVAKETSSPKVSIRDNSVLKLTIPEQLPEQTNNVEMQNFSFKDEKVIGVHDLAKTIIKASDDPNIKGIYLQNTMYDHGYSTLKIIRDALLQFKNKGKFILSYGNYYNHKNYFLASTADNIFIHPLGFVELKGFGATIPFFKELMEKVGIKYNIYYAGEFKSATEPYRLSKMSDQNKLQLREYLESQLDEYIAQVAKSRNLSESELRNNFDQFLSYTPQRAIENKVLDKAASEQDVFIEIRNKLNIKTDENINFVSVSDYYNAKGIDTDYSAKNKVAVVFAEGTITDEKGSEGEIGKKYLKIIRDIRTNDKVKAIVLRVNSPGGSALMSDELLHELDLTRAAGKPIVVSMGDYAASGGYYISCHADSIFASPHTLTGSIGVFMMIPNIKVLTDEKIGIDFDTVGTGPMSNKFDITANWGTQESTILQENTDNTYKRFLEVVSSGRKLSMDATKEIAKGRIWTGPKAIDIGLVNRIGELNDAIECAAKLASLDKYRVAEYPAQDDAFQKLIKKFQDKDEDVQSQITNGILKEEMGQLYPYYLEYKNIQKMKGPQMRLPFKIIY
ncbi:MAG: signal peptide peptidase SppA [Saprospiraceae bacterium]|nr:signal peptide peptidase SppA [Saprospiraceae bacterium]